MGHFPQAGPAAQSLFYSARRWEASFLCLKHQFGGWIGSNHAWWFFKAHYLGAFEEWEPFWETYDPTCLSNFGVAHFQNTIFSIAATYINQGFFLLLGR
jgi:hypothetical protein